MAAINTPSLAPSLLYPEVLRLLSLWDLIWKNIPSDRKAEGRPAITSWPGDVLTPPGPGKVFCHLTRETLERTPIPLGNWTHPYQPGDELWVKDWKKEPLQPVWTGLTWSSWQPLVLLKLQVSPSGSTTPESRRQRLPVTRTPGKQFRTLKTSSRSGSEDSSSHPWSMLSPALA